MTVRVSVVIPVYNGEAFVADAVRSALTQTISDVEVLVADNGSTDATWSILQRLAAEDPRVRPLKALTGRGPDVGRNACLDVARGEWVAILDADDVMLPERLERLLALAEARAAEIVADNQRLVDPQGKLIRLAWQRDELPDKVDAADFILANVFGKKMAALGYVKPVFRRELIVRTGIRYRPRPRVVEDFIFMQALLLTGKTLHLTPEAYYNYVQMPNSLSRSFGADELNDCQAVNDAILAEATDPRLRRALLLRRRSIRSFLAHGEFIEAVKKRQLGRALGIVAGHPPVMHFILHFGRESVEKRLRRLAQRGRPQAAAAPPAAPVTGGQMTGGQVAVEPRPAGPQVAYFGQDCTDSAVIRRIAALQAAGLKVSGFTFRREKFNRDYVPAWDNVPLGETRDRQYRDRLVKLARAVGALIRHRRKLAAAEMFYARNIDMALLALFGRLLGGRGAPLVYEVLDVQRALLGSDPKARLLRWVERRVLAQSRLLVVSSPGFVREYFEPRQGFRGDWFLLENKILGAQLRAAAATPGRPAKALVPERNGRWVIGWFGTLRCVKSLAMLAELAQALPDRVVVYLRGFPTETGLGPFLEVVDRHPNMIYGGEFFSPHDLPDIYGAVDFAWGFDFLDAGSNSDWLLPNRLYDAGYFNVPVLAADHTETGRRVRELGLGWSFPAPFVDALKTFFATLTPEQHAGRRAALAALPRGLFCEEDETKRLVKAVLSVPTGPMVRIPAETAPTAE